MTDRGPGPVFSHGWDRYTDFVDFFYHHVHASCLISEHPVEVVFIQVDVLGHRGFLFELKGTKWGTSSTLRFVVIFCGKWKMIYPVCLSWKKTAFTLSTHKQHEKYYQKN